MAPLPLLFMVLASAALLFALVAWWSSLRQALAAAGDASAAPASAELPDRAALLDEKKSLLRAIKDLEYEHEVGKISAEDFERLDRAYRARAREVLALLEQDLAPYQARAEAMLAAHAPAQASAPEPEPEAPAARKDDEDEAALRERARKLREEADRLEQRARERVPADRDPERDETAATERKEP